MTAKSTSIHATATFGGIAIFLYALSLFYWWVIAAQPPGDVLFLGLVLGLGCGATAYILSHNSAQIGASAPLRPYEGVLLISYIGLLTLYLTSGPGYSLDALLQWLNFSVPHDLTSLVEKLVLFVAVPWYMFFHRLGRGRDYFGLTTPLRKAMTPKSLTTMLVFFGIFTAIQVFASSQWPTFLEAADTPTTLIVGLLFSYGWLFIEAGLVEEFCFRAVIQDRLGQLLKSPWRGMIVSSMIFALAHVPGLYFRIFDGGQSIWFVLSYAMLILAPASVVFGILWMRTRNLLLLIAIHASVDTIPNFPSLTALIGL